MYPLTWEREDYSGDVGGFGHGAGPWHGDATVCAVTASSSAATTVSRETATTQASNAVRYAGLTIAVPSARTFGFARYPVLPLPR